MNVRGSKKLGILLVVVLLSNYYFVYKSIPSQISSLLTSHELEQACFSASLPEGNRTHLKVTFIETEKVPYANLLQTSSGNKGFRLELTLQNEVAVIVGDPSDKIEDGFALAGVNPGVNQIELWIDYQKVTGRLNSGPRSWVTFKSKPLCDEVKLAKGYNSQRTFRGITELYVG